MRPRHRSSCMATARPRARSGRRFALAIAIAAVMSVLVTAPASAQSSADSTIVLHWTAPGDDGNVGRATTYALRYRTVYVTGADTMSWWNAAVPVNGLPSPSTAGATDSMRVRALTPVTTYYFILRAADEAANWSGFSNIATATTGGDNVAPAAIADLTVTGQTGTTLVLRWTAPGDDGSSGTATSYDVRYSTSTITASNWNAATTAVGEPAPAAPGTTQTFTLAGLQGGRTYHVAIRTLDNGGNLSAISNVATGTTTDTIAPATVQDLSYGPVPGDGETRQEIGFAEPRGNDAF
jgi:hypothetical protein